MANMMPPHFTEQLVVMEDGPTADRVRALAELGETSADGKSIRPASVSTTLRGVIAAALPIIEQGLIDSGLDPAKLAAAQGRARRARESKARESKARVGRVRERRSAKRTGANG